MTEDDFLVRRLDDWLPGGRRERLIDGIRLHFDYEQAIRQERARRIRELPSGTSPSDLSQTGWGVIFAEEEEYRVKERLSRLLEYRKAQAGKLYCCEVHQKRWGRTFLWYDKGESPGTIDPEALPYYLLLVGNPEHIPFEFQYELAVNRAVGRVYFEDPIDYERYAHAVVEAEENGVNRSKKVSVFSVEQGDDATDVLSSDFVKPFAEKLPKRVPDWPVEVLRDQKKYLENLLQGTGATPGLLLVASHGKRLDFGHPEQEALQGAVVCRDGFFHAGDLASLAPDDRPLHGLVAGLFACHSAGTPIEDSFSLRANEKPSVLTEKEFVARLPRALLARGALAVLGHVDRGWTASFRWLYRDKKTEASRSIEDAIVRMLWRNRVGHALRPIYRRYSSIAAHLQTFIEALLNERPLEKNELDRHLIAFIDARNYIVLGDPAVYVGGRPGEHAVSEGATKQTLPILDVAEPVYLDPDLARRARYEARSQRLELNAFVHEALERHLPKIDLT